MARDQQDELRRINSLKEKVKQTQNAAAATKAHFDQATEDLETAREAARQLGIDPMNPRAFERWLEKEATEIEELIEKANGNLEKVREAIDGR